MVQSIDGIGEATSATFGAQSSQLTAARQNGFQAAAQLLGLSASELRAAVANGQSIAELAISQGLSSTDLQNAIEAALKKHLPNATQEQIERLARQLIEGRGEHHRGARQYGTFASDSDEDESASGTGAGADDGTSHIHVVV